MMTSAPLVLVSELPGLVSGEAGPEVLQALGVQKEDVPAFEGEDLPMVGQQTLLDQEPADGASLAHSLTNQHVTLQSQHL